MSTTHAPTHEKCLPSDGFARWNSRVWRLAGPIILANISTPLLGAVDTAVMGHLPDPAYIGGVAIGAVIFGMVLIGLSYTAIDQDWYLVFLGGMLPVAVLFNNMIRRRVTGERS